MSFNEFQNKQDQTIFAVFKGAFLSSSTPDAIVFRCHVHLQSHGAMNNGLLVLVLLTRAAQPQ
ncbi:7193_t:CDS:1, partial [Acaulospora morrowiae]